MCFMFSILPGFRAPAASPKSVSLICPLGSMRKFCGRAVQHSSLVTRRKTHFGLEVPMDVPELVQLRYSAEHLGDVEPRVLLLEDPRVVEERAKVSPCDEVLRRWSAS